MRHLFLVFAAAAVLLGGSASAGASVIYSTFGPGDSYDTTEGWLIGSIPAVSNYQPGNSFVPVGGSYALESIELAVSSSVNNEFYVQLMSDQAGKPGTLIESFYFLNAQGTWGYDAPPVSGVSALHPLLTEGTRYWLTAWTPDTNVDAGLMWNFNNIGAMGSLAYRYDGLDTWYVSGYSGSSVSAFRVNGVDQPTATPEPASVLLFGLGGGLLAMYRVRNNRNL